MDSGIGLQTKRSKELCPRVLRCRLGRVCRWLLARLLRLLLLLLLLLPLLPWLLPQLLHLLRFLRLLLCLCQRHLLTAEQVQAGKLHRVGCAGVCDADHPQPEAPGGRRVRSRRANGQQEAVEAVWEVQLPLLVQHHPGVCLCRQG